MALRTVEESDSLNTGRIKWNDNDAELFQITSDHLADTGNVHNATPSDIGAAPTIHGHPEYLDQAAGDTRYYTKTLANTTFAGINHSHVQPVYYKWFYGEALEGPINGTGWEHVMENRTLQRVIVEFDTAPTVNTTIVITRKTSGGALSQIATVTVLANQKKGEVIGLNVALSDGDSLRRDFTAATDGANVSATAKAI